jgi:FtsZ-binding cell division protein ZapB
MQNIEGIISGLQAEIDLLKAENKALRKENAKLKEKLGLTSKNSSIPSSKELYKLKREKVKSIRNRGGQPGHPATTRAKMIADEVIDLPISDACQCGGRVAISPKPFYEKI